MVDNTKGIDASSITSDTNWIKQAFFIPGNAFHNTTNKDPIGEWAAIRSQEKVGRRFSSAEIKFTDTTPGGNFSINARPQFTRWADPKMPGLSRDSKGMGEYYSEAIDDNTQRIHMQFGVPSYNSLTNYFSRFYDYELGHLVNTGETPGFSFYVGKAAGFLLTLPLQILIGANNLLQRLMAFASGNPYSKFYYLKPTMPLYLSSVSVLVNKLAVNMGLAYGPHPTAVSGKEPEALASKLDYGDGEDPKAISRLLPDVFGDSGGIDMYMVASRAQRLAAQHADAVKDLGLGMDGEGYAKAVKTYLTSKMNPNAPKHGNLPGYLNKFYNGLTMAQADKKITKPEVIEHTDPKAQAKVHYDTRVEVAGSYDKDSDQLFTGMLQDGTAFVSFSVDYEGSTGESFSNSTKTSEVANKINSTSSSARDFKFNFAGGNIMDNPIGDLIGGVINGALDVVKGAADSVGLSGLFALAGNAYADIPDVWDNSTANLPRSNYTIKLATPYGNKLSIMTNIYIPLCMLLAGALPRTTGRSSYGPPFICKLWSKGRNTIQLGIIDSLTIERGTGGIGWSADGLPTAVDVSFSVISLDKNMHVPIAEIGGPSNVFTMSMFDEDTAATDYLASLGSLSLYEQYYLKPRLSLAIAKTMADMESWISPAHWASRFAGSTNGRRLSYTYRATSRG